MSLIGRGSGEEKDIALDEKLLMMAIMLRIN